MDAVIWQGNAQAAESRGSVDPLLAACAHNKEFSLLLKLPDEILLAIIGLLLQSDNLAIYYLRRVCRKLRYLSEDKTLGSGYLCVPRKYMYNPSTHILHDDRFISRETTGINAHRLRWDVVQKFETTIRKETLCKPCQIAHQEDTLPNECVFTETPTRYLYCAGCDTYHASNAFSHTQRRKGPAHRICVGREGRLRLCEHVSISWADIQAHLTASAGRHDFCKAVSDFHVVCKHPSHTFACKSASRIAPSEASCNDHTRPCARLQMNQHSTVLRWTPLSLVLCWKPYASSKILTAPENGQIEATKLRELYGEYGKNAARFIVPGPSQNPTPEMLCFDPDTCGHILYRNGKRPEATPYTRLRTAHPSSKNESLPGTELCLDEDHQDPSRFTGLGWTAHYVEFNEARGQSGIYVHECEEKHDSQDTTQCIMTSYRRAISLADVDSRRPGALNPSHEWFHAVDQDSYPSIRAEGSLWPSLTAYFDNTKSRPRCRDAACRNYYQSPGPWHLNPMHVKAPLPTTRGVGLYHELTSFAHDMLTAVKFFIALSVGASLHRFFGSA